MRLYCQAVPWPDHRLPEGRHAARESLRRARPVLNAYPYPEKRLPLPFQPDCLTLTLILLHSVLYGYNGVGRIN